MEGMTEYKYNKELVEVMSRLAVKLIKNNPGAAPLGSAIAGKIINDWSFGSRVKKIVSYPVRKCLKCQCDSNKDEDQTSIAADVGRLLTMLATAANQERETYPEQNSWDRGEAVREFLANTDFGEILELVKRSEAGVQKTMDAFNEALWTYPTKFGALLCMLMCGLRMGVKGVTEAIAPIKRDIGPDLLGDIICSLVRDIKPEEIARLVDSLGELVRRTHTGSQLVGQGDKSKLEVYLDDVIAAYHGAKDPYLQKMLPIYLGEIRESIAKSSARSLTHNRKILLAQLASLGPAKTSDLRVKTARLQAIKSVEDEEFGSTMSESIQGFGTYDAADLVNTICGLLNKLHDVNADLIGSTLSAIADSISADEVKKTASWLIPDIVNAIKPLVQEIKPDLLMGLAELLRNDGYWSSEDDAAMQELRATLGISGGER